MSLERAFLDDIIANRADDTPRLVYADWLDEQGQEQTAAFIRLQVEQARLPVWSHRAIELNEELKRLRQQRPKPFAELSWARGLKYRRGFPASGFLTEGRPGPEASLCTLDELVLSYRGWDWESLAHWPCLSQVWTLRLPEFAHYVLFAPPSAEGRMIGDYRYVPSLSGPDDLRALFGSPYLNNVRSLDLGRWTHGDRPLLSDRPFSHWWLEGGNSRAAAEALRDWPGFGQLRELRLTGLGLGDHWARLADARQLPSLVQLDLLSTNMSGLGLEGLARAGLFRSVESLRLNARCGFDGIRAVVFHDQLTALRELDLSRSGLRREELEELAYTISLEQVESLVLDDTSVGRACAGTEDLIALLPSRLGRLSLRNCGITQADAEALAGWPGLSGLAVLNLADNPIGKKGAWALARSPFLENVRQLTLDCPAGPVEKELTGRFGRRWWNSG